MGVTRARVYRPRSFSMPPGKAKDREFVRDAMLARRYCSSDCLLDAVARGYPKTKKVEIVGLMKPKEKPK